MKKKVLFLLITVIAACIFCFSIAGANTVAFTFSGGGTGVGEFTLDYAAEVRFYFNAQGGTVSGSALRYIMLIQNSAGQKVYSQYISFPNSTTTTWANETVRINLSAGKYVVRVGSWEIGFGSNPGHNWSVSVSSEVRCEHRSTKTTSDATCTKGGIAVVVCNNCRTTLSRREVKALGHSYGTWRVTKAATCTALGEKVGVCERCSYNVTQKIDMLPHTKGESVVKKEPTCTDEGIEAVCCSVCQNEYQTNYIDKLEHNYGEWVINKLSTCTENGEKSRTCVDCQNVDSAVVDMLEHNYGDWKITKEPTCIATGEETISCLDCGCVSDTRTVDVIEHSYGEWVIEKEASCAEEGLLIRVCAVCSNSESENIEKEEHDLEKWTVVEEATCTKVGERSRTCENCEYSEKESIDKKDHAFGKWVVAKNATESSKGEKRRECRDCGYEESETIPKLICGDETSWEITKESTCTSEGMMTETCDYCGKIVSQKTMGTDDHEVKEWTVTKKAKPNSKGTRQGRCVNCHNIVTESFKHEVPGRDGFKKGRNYGKGFADVHNGQWFYDYVKTSYEYTLANGMGDNLFAPDNKFTVAQALAAAANIHSAYYAYEIDTSGSYQKWYTPYIDYCIENDIITKNQFSDYEKNITRGEMAMVFANILPTEEYKSVRTGAPTDMESAMPSYNAVRKLYRAGIVSGDAETGTYRPDDEIVRSEACVIFTRIAVDSYRAK
ncbi:MAG: S-layer homology domain-containing protein [Clostridia bacterium]|nr:S-layer homology domain-containing protein [Clostridia bacterium]